MFNVNSSATTRMRAIRFAMFAAVLFIVMTLMAMLLYPGGTIRQPDNSSYDFFRNFFSDLGRTESFTGEPQWASCILFATALCTAGLAFIGFFYHFPSTFKGIPRAEKLAKWGSVFGWMAAICYIGIALTPWNLVSDAHMIFVKTGMPAFLLAAILYAIAIFRCPDYPKVYMWVFIAFAPILLGYIYLLFWGPSSKTTSGLILQATWQKALVYSEIVTLLIQGYGLLQREKRNAAQDNAMA